MPTLSIIVTWLSESHQSHRWLAAGIKYCMLVQGNCACLPCHAPGKCGGNRLWVHPEGKHELKELWAQAKGDIYMNCFCNKIEFQNQFFGCHKTSNAQIWIIWPLWKQGAMMPWLPSCCSLKICWIIVPPFVQYQQGLLNWVGWVELSEMFVVLLKCCAELTLLFPCNFQMTAMAAQCLSMNDAHWIIIFNYRWKVDVKVCLKSSMRGWTGAWRYLCKLRNGHTKVNPLGDMDSVGFC
jgi:hypothetical protein